MSKRTLTNYKGVYQRESSETVFKGKPDLCYDIAYRVDGKLIWEKAGWLSEGYSAKLASEIRSQRMKQIRHGEELPKEKKKAPFMKDAWDKYYAWAKDSKTRAARDDKNRYHKNIEPRFSEKRLNEISSFDLERLKADLSRQGLADATVKHVLVLIRQIYNKAILWGFYQGPKPLSGVKLPVPQNQRERFLTHEEAALLLERLKEKSPLWHDITVIALHTGLRASEIFSLRGHDLDFDQELVNVDDTKNKHPRKAFMTEGVKDILMLREPAIPGDLVFLNKKGERITEVSRTFDRTVDELGFNRGITDNRQKVVFHSLRHTFASNLAIQGTPLHVIAELTGHRQMNMVQRYSHLSPDVKRKAVKQMEKGFSQPQKENAIFNDRSWKIVNHL